MKSIIIFHPSYYFGGISVLYSRLYAELSSNSLYTVRVIDYNDGFISKEILENGGNEKIIGFPDCSEDSREILRMTDDYVVLMSSTQVRKAKAYFSKYQIDPTIVVGVYHPFEASIQFVFKARSLLSFFGYHGIKYYQHIFPLMRRKILSFVKKGISSNGLYFMDLACYRATSYFLSLDVQYEKNISLIPVPFSNKLSTNIKENKNKGLNFGYVGRIEDFKTLPLINFISDLNELNLEHINLYVIGDGKDFKLIKKLVEVKYKKINTIFLGALPNDESRKIMQECVDIAACMGTAALDTSSVGLPTILLNPLEKNIAEYRYNWLHLSENFVLGDYADAPWYVENGKKLEELVQEAKSDYIGTSLKAINYVKEKHSLETVCQSITNLANSSSFKLSDVPFRKLREIK